MKLRRLFPAAALGLLVGVASAVAEEPADEDSRSELIYSFGESAAPAKEDNPMAKALLQYAGASDPANGWSGSVSYQNDGSAPDDTLRDYDFAVPFDEGETETIGVVGYIDDDSEIILTGAGLPTAGVSSSDKKTYSILYFEKKAYRNAPDTVGILSERSLAEDSEEDEDKEPLIAPLSAPISMFITILGLGILVVSYTSKTKK